jgi:hypothetical protein
MSLSWLDVEVDGVLVASGRCADGNVVIFRRHAASFDSGGIAGS